MSAYLHRAWWDPRESFSDLDFCSADVYFWSGKSSHVGPLNGKNILWFLCTFRLRITNGHNFQLYFYTVCVCLGIWSLLDASFSLAHMLLKSLLLWRQKESSGTKWIPCQLLPLCVIPKSGSALFHSWSHLHSFVERHWWSLSPLIKGNSMHI